MSLSLTCSRFRSFIHSFIYSCVCAVVLFFFLYNCCCCFVNVCCNFSRLHTIFKLSAFPSDILAKKCFVWSIWNFSIATRQFDSMYAILSRFFFHHLLRLALSLSLLFLTFFFACIKSFHWTESLFSIRRIRYDRQATGFMIYKCMLHFKTVNHSSVSLLVCLFVCA